MFKKAMFDRGIRFCAFVRNDEDIARIENLYGCVFIKFC